MEMRDTCQHFTACLQRGIKAAFFPQEKAIGTFVSKSETASSPKPHIVVDSPHSD